MNETITSASPEASALPEAMAPARRLEAYRLMLRARTMDERCLTLQRQGRIGFYVPMQGQEAAQIGCALALEPEDWIFPAYRELGLALARGVPPRLLLDQFIGNSGDELRGRQMPNHYGYRRFNFVTASSPVGTQISHAVGAAMAAMQRRERRLTIAFFGDGTTSSNDFHAGLNFAGVFRTPTVFFCQNNQWAISMPRERQTRSATLAEKARAYGFEGQVVDGMDVGAVFAAVRRARDRALQGQGPTLLEAQVYRLGPHSTSDDPRRYRTEAELETWRGRDPLARLKQELLADGGLTAEQDAQWWEEAKQEIAQAVTQAEATAPLDPRSIFEDVFAQPIPTLDREREEFEALLHGGTIRP